LGVHTDPDKARQWYQKAARTDNTEAMCDLAFLYQFHGNFEQAHQWFHKAADKGDPFAMTRLGHVQLRQLVRDGPGRGPGLRPGARVYQKAAEAGNANAKRALLQLPSR
jgi:TPR repeat protein